MGKAAVIEKDSVSNVGGTPADWNDRKGWDRYHAAKCSKGPFAVPTAVGVEGWQSVRFLDLVKGKGGRVWFPGCGVDVGPRFYASVGCQVLATDFSQVAVKWQRNVAQAPPERLFADWSSFKAQSESSVQEGGRLDVVEHDFTSGPAEGEFDAVLNCRAFQGLSTAAMAAAAKHFYAALRPGGVAVIDTMNVQGNLRNAVEDSILGAGFFIPYNNTERWYRSQLDGTGITYGMLLGRPRVQFNRQNPAKRSMAQWERDQAILDSFTDEYQLRRLEEEPLTVEIAARPETKVAYVIYPTG